MAANFVTRFAPSPTGRLHLGHAFSALTVFDIACRQGGRFILRIEDIDQTRCKPAFEDAIIEDLKWLGLEWENPVRRQSDHFDDYASALDQLRERNLVYRCFKTRKEIAEEIARAPHLPPAGPEGPQYIGEALSADEERARLAEGAPFAWRLNMARAVKHAGALDFIEEGLDAAARTIKATPEIFGDPVIARKDSTTSYHLASVYDDALQGVTHVIRGEDLFASTHLHRLLQKLLGLPAPNYRHHHLITDKNGKRFAKRDQSATIRAMRESGVSLSDLRAQLGLPR